MNALPQLLSGLLITCVALVSSGAAWSETQANAPQGKATAAKVAPKAVVKKVKKAKKKVKPAAKPVAATVTLNPYLPGASAPVVAKTNPYLAGIPGTTAAAPLPHVSAPVAVAPVAPALPLALSKSLAGMPPVAASAVDKPVQEPAQAKVAPVAPVVAVAPPAATSVPIAVAPAAPVPAVAVASKPQASQPAPEPGKVAVTGGVPPYAYLPPVPRGGYQAAPVLSMYPSVPASYVPRAFSAYVAASAAPVAPYVAPVPHPPVVVAPSQPVTPWTPPAQTAQPVTPWSTPAAVAPSAPAKYAGNPYLVNSMAFNQVSTPSFQPGMLSTGLISLPAGLAPSSPIEMSQLMNDLRSFLPDLHLPSADIDILPSLKKVYPTGEKPLYVLTFKCPTELIGITPLPTKALRWLISSGMEAANSTDLLPFNMQQVCQ